MQQKKTGRKVIVKKKNHKAKGKPEQEEPQMARVGFGAGNDWHTVRSRDGWYSTLPSSTDSILEKARRIHHMERGFFTTPIWDPRQRREDLHFFKYSDYGGLGFFDYRDIWGNDKGGYEWVDEQKRNNDYEIRDEDQYKKLHPEQIEEQQIIYIEPSPAEKKLEELRERGLPFQDDDFPPNDQSLDNNRRTFDFPIQWQRVSHKMDRPSLFKNKIQPQDIQQGMLGDCYLLATLAALAQRPDRIYNLFLLQEDNELKYYSVKILFRGKWRTIDLDQLIPFTSQNQPAFSRSKENELWVIILEKAWAKLYGSYKNIQAGYPQQCLHDLTGAPIKQVIMSHYKFNPENQWNYLLQASQKQYSMVAASQPGSDINQSVSGVVQGHAYTFLNATYVNYKNGYDTYKDKIVQLRNPWGKVQFSGRWADNDYAWNLVSPEEKKRLGYDPDANDGIFFMSYETFIKEFNVVTVAEINDNASYVYECYYDPDCRGAYFTVEILVPGKYSIHLDKTPERTATEGYTKDYFNYPVGELGVRKIDGTPVLYQGLLSRRRTLFRLYELTPGRHVVFAKLQYDGRFQKDFEVNVAVYSQYACNIRLATPEEANAYEQRQDTYWNPEGYSRKDEGQSYNQDNYSYPNQNRYTFGNVSQGIQDGPSNNLIDSGNQNMQSSGQQNLGSGLHPNQKPEIEQQKIQSQNKQEQGEDRDFNQRSNEEFPMQHGEESRQPEENYESNQENQQINKQQQLQGEPQIQQNQREESQHDQQNGSAEQVNEQNPEAFENQNAVVDILEVQAQPEPEPDPQTRPFDQEDYNLNPSEQQPNQIDEPQEQKPLQYEKDYQGEVKDQQGGEKQKESIEEAQQHVASEGIDEGAVDGQSQSRPEEQKKDKEGQGFDEEDQHIVTTQHKIVTKTTKVKKTTTTTVTGEDGIPVQETNTVEEEHHEVIEDGDPTAEKLQEKDKSQGDSQKENLPSSQQAEQERMMRELEESDPVQLPENAEERFSGQNPAESAPPNLEAYEQQPEKIQGIQNSEEGHNKQFFNQYANPNGHKIHNSQSEPPEALHGQQQQINQNDFRGHSGEESNKEE